MKLHRLLILGGAAWAGTMFYKFQYVPTGVDAGTGSTHAPTTSGTSEPAQGRSLYSSINGPGSLGNTVRQANSARNSGSTPPNTYANPNPNLQGGGGIIGTGRPQQNGIGSTGRRNSGSPAVEDMAPDDMDLIQAAAKGDKNLVESRISSRVKIDSRDSNRRTPLMYAAWNGYDDIANRLLAAGANPELRDRDGNNAFDYAASRGLVDSLHFLLQRTHTNDDHYMEYAQIIQATYAADPARLPEGTGKLTSVNHVNPEGQGPLHIAAGNGSLQLIDALVKRGAKVNLANNNKQTPLHWAAWNNQASVVKYLIEQGGDISATDYGGNTPLILAAQNGGTESVQQLLAKGADRYAANKEGKTASIVAEDKGFNQLAQLLK